MTQREIANDFARKMRWHDMQSRHVRDLSNEYGANMVRQMVVGGVPEYQLDTMLARVRAERAVVKDRRHRA